MILDNSGNERRNFMSVLMPQARASECSMRYLESIHYIEIVELFLEQYHSSQNKILFLNNRKNDLTDQVPTIDEQIEAYLLQYMRDHEII